MDHATFDSYTRRAALDRRSILGMIGALFATGTGLGTADAKKKHKDNKKKRCKRIAKRCRAGNPAYCQENFPDEVEACVATLNQCCGFFGKCKNGKAFACCENAGYCDPDAHITVKRQSITRIWHSH